MGDRLARIDMGRKLGTVSLLGELNPSSSLATTDVGRKLGGLRPFFRGGGAWSPSSTMWAEAYLFGKFHLDPRNRLATIHQRYGQTDRQHRTGQTGQDSGPIALGEPFYKRSPKNHKCRKDGINSVCKQAERNQR